MTTELFETKVTEDPSSKVGAFASAWADREGKVYRTDFPSTSGIAWIALERARQFVVHGYDGNHDDEHQAQELPRAAMAYLMAGMEPQGRLQGIPPWEAWPWSNEQGFVPQKTRVENLAAAGAMIAAEIDRVQRETERVERVRPIPVRKDDLEALLVVARAAVNGHVAATDGHLADALDRVGEALG